MGNKSRLKWNMLVTRIDSDAGPGPTKSLVKPVRAAAINRDGSRRPGEALGPAVGARAGVSGGK